MWQADSSCIGWLDRQRAGSVVYVSFGSWVGPIGPDKIRELALGLEATGRPFLWALKKDPAWRAGLPDGYPGAGRGKVVDWAPQEDVLRHSSVGCFLTHCGWNSAVEAIQHGVRLLCWPVLGDHFVNCAYITGVWEIGIKLGSVSKDQVRECIERIMEGEEGTHLQEKMNVLRKNVATAEAKSLAQRNVESFVNEIRKDYPLLMRM
jgi:UDP:flavonoid glycosyltransferase YjiC (YdhE family)